MRPIFIFLGGLCMLFLMLHERARVFAALVIFFFVVLSGASLLGIDLRFWR